MSLLSVDITKKRRLSLKEVKLPAPESQSRKSDKAENQIIILSDNYRDANNQIVKPPTAEEITYHKFTALNQAIDLLVDSLDLVSTITGERIRKITPEDAIKATVEPPETATGEKVQDEPKEPAKSNKIGDIALRIITPINNLSKEQIIAGIMDETKVTRERAERGFSLMIESGVIQGTNVNTYYLTGSTPF